GPAAVGVGKCLLPGAAVVVNAGDNGDRFPQAAALRNVGDGAVEGLADTVGDEGRSGEGGRPLLAVDAVADVREARIAVGLLRGEVGPARVDVAENVGPDEGADPLPVRIPASCRLLYRDLLDQIPVGRSLRGVGLVIGQAQQPLLGHVLRGEVVSVLLEEVEPVDGVVDVVVTAGSMHAAPGGLLPVVGPELVTLTQARGRRDVVGQRVGTGGLEVLTQPGTRPVDTPLDRLAEHVAGYASAP